MYTAFTINLMPYGSSFFSPFTMLLKDINTAPTFRSSSVVIDWSKERMQQKFDPQSLVQWVQSFPAKDDVHVYLGNMSFNGQRSLMRQLQALGCTVTCKQYCG